MKLVSLLVFCFFTLLNTFNASIGDPPNNFIDKSLSREDSPRKLQAKENYISITFTREVHYGSFNGNYRHDIKHIYNHYDGKTYAAYDGMTVHGNVPIDIYFTIPMTDMTNFFWNERGFLYNVDQNLDYLRTVDFSHFDASELHKTYSMFKFCYNLVSVNFENFHAPKLEYAKNMFEDCDYIEYLNFSTFYAPNLAVADKMFSECTELKLLDLSNLLLPKLVSAKNIFYYAYNLGYVILKNFLYNPVLIEALREAAKGNLIICQPIPYVTGSFVNNF